MRIAAASAGTMVPDDVLPFAAGGRTDNGLRRATGRVEEETGFPSAAPPTSVINLVPEALPSGLAVNEGAGSRLVVEEDMVVLPLGARNLTCEEDISLFVGLRET